MQCRKVLKIQDCRNSCKDDKEVLAPALGPQLAKCAQIKNVINLWCNSLATTSFIPSSSNALTWIAVGVRTHQICHQRETINSEHSLLKSHRCCNFFEMCLENLLNVLTHALPELPNLDDDLSRNVLNLNRTKQMSTLIEPKPLASGCYADAWSWTAYSPWCKRTSNEPWL